MISLVFFLHCLLTCILSDVVLWAIGRLLCLSYNFVGVECTILSLSLCASLCWSPCLFSAHSLIVHQHNNEKQNLYMPKDNEQSYGNMCMWNSWSDYYISMIWSKCWQSFWASDQWPSDQLTFWPVARSKEIENKWFQTFQHGTEWKCSFCSLLPLGHV